MALKKLVKINKGIPLIALFLIGAIFSCKEESKAPSKMKYVSGEALGTTYHIKYFSEDNFDASTKVDSIFKAINLSMSTYQQDSDISKINHGDTSVVVDDMFKEVYELSEIISRNTKGYFDPTVGNIVNAYGFGGEKVEIKLDSVKIDSMMTYVGMDKIALTSENRIKKSSPNVYLEFNSIAKGYTVDRLGIMLEKAGVNNYLVELGGELRARGKNIDSQKNWRVGIDNPQTKDRSFSTVISLKNVAMATSGNYRKFRLDSLTGKRYVHTINPLTGYSYKSDILSASVLANTCAEADAYATAFMAMGYSKALVVLEEIPGIEVYFIYDEAGTVKTYASKGFLAAGAAPKGDDTKTN